MKRIVFFLFFCGAFASPLTPKQPGASFPAICSEGPTHWCQNFRTARECGATKHCIQTVWEHLRLEQDTDDICTICKDMVAQARDQLQSNETQEELKEVFDGSCKLMPIKVIAKECMKLADEFVPELVEALASQMNPQVVCATAGLCNSARIDHMLEQLHANRDVQVVTSADPNAKFGKECSNCHKVVTGAAQQLAALSDEQVLSKMIKACGHLGSLSSGCHDVVISNFNVIMQHVRQHFNAKEVCDLAGVCKAMHHEHAQVAVEVVPRGETGVSRKDETCELCEQLVKHLRDVLVTNTTEEEFKDVLKGICGQTKTFKKQCLSLVNEYYPMVYSFLLHELDPRAVCDFAGICHEEVASGAPLWLELPARQGFPVKPISLQEVVHVYNRPEQLVGDDEAHSYGNDGLVAPGTRADPDAELVHIPLAKSSSNVRVVDMQLPVERYLPQTLIGGNRELCELCQYFLHYVQEEITSPATEAEIKEVVDEACDRLPKVISQQCRSFVATYGDAFVALLAQEMDPSQVCSNLFELSLSYMLNCVQICPQLGLCPAGQLLKIKKSGEPMCPLCLYAVEQMEKLIKEDKTEANIRAALDKVCTLLPASMKQECITMVEKYTEELVDMLIADLTPQEICVYLKVCKPQTLPTPSPQQQKDTEIMTNEIPEWPVAVVQDDDLVQRIQTAPKLKDDNPKCIICEFVMSQLDDMLKNNATEEEIKDAVHTVCNYLPTSVAKQCNDFVYEYADMVIQLLVQELDPKAVCQELSLCQPNAKPTAVPAQASEAVCKLCMVVVDAMDKLLEDGNVEQDIDNLLEKVCTVIPSAEKQKCEEMIEQYGPAIAMLVAQLADSRDVCSELKLCDKSGVRHRLLGGSKCTWGPSYWCQSEFHAMACKATKHCQQKVWKAVKPAERAN